jgi:hypothetical protein
MLASINPLGERARNNSFGVTVAAYTLGSTVAAAALGLVLGAVGAALLGGVDPGVRLAVLAVAALVAAALDRRDAPLPSWHRQVNEDWLTEYRGWVYGLGFGVQLGVGVVTIVTTAAVYLTWASALLAASPAVGLVVGVAFGLARALPVVAGARVRTPAAVGARGRALDAAAGRFRVVTVVAELAVALGSVALLVGGRG